MSNHDHGIQIDPGSWQDFAVNVVKYEEGDPAMFALSRSGVDQATKMRYVHALLTTFYHTGIAGQAAEHEGQAYWDYMQAIYHTARRRSERRHFRGKAGLLALERMQATFKTPEGMVEYLWASSYLEVRAKAKKMPKVLVGDYFIWKHCDAQDSVFNIPCDYTGSEEYSFEAPKTGAAMIAPLATTAEAYALIYNHVRQHVPMAPPFYSRPVGIPDAETVCCYWTKRARGAYVHGGPETTVMREFAEYPCALNNLLTDCIQLGLGYTKLEAGTTPDKARG